MKTIGLIVLAALGLLGVYFKTSGVQFGEIAMMLGFFGFPVLYGYVTWPSNQKIPSAQWFVTIGIMLLFAFMILNKF